MRLQFRKLSPESDTSSLDCTDEDGTDPFGLQVFVTQEAFTYQAEKLGVTYLAFYEERLVGFVTVSMTCLKIEEVEEEEKVGEIRVPYPALLLGRLAVDKGLRRKGIGTSLCEFAIGLAVDISERVGCRYVALHTLPNRVSFYTQEPLSFVESSLERRDNKKLLYRRIAD
jgi:GNAT superfamily N-acetyltransferase